MKSITSSSMHHKHGNTSSIQDYVGADTVNSLQEQLQQMNELGIDRLSGLGLQAAFPAQLS